MATSASRKAAAEQRLDLDGPIVAFLQLLANASDDSAVAPAVAGMLAQWSPEQVAVYLVDTAGEALVAVSHFGFDADQVRRYVRVPLEVAVPVTRVFRTGAEGAWRMAQAAEEFPAVAGWAAAHPARATAEVLGLPLRNGGRTIGVLLVSFPSEVERTWRLRQLLEASVASIGVWGRCVEHHAFTRATRPDARVVLTERQRRVLRLVGDGSTNAEIAAIEVVSIGTVKADLAHLFRVFDVRHRGDLAGVAGLVEH